jgi:Winged helix-turn helix
LKIVDIQHLARPGGLGKVRQAFSPASVMFSRWRPPIGFGLSPAAQRERIQMVLLRESGMTQPAIAEAMGVSLSTVNRAHMAYDGGGIKASRSILLALNSPFHRLMQGAREVVRHVAERLEDHPLVAETRTATARRIVRIAIYPANLRPPAKRPRHLDRATRRDRGFIPQRQAAQTYTRSHESS